MNVKTVDNLSKIPFIKHGFFGRNGGFSSGIFESLNVGISRGDDDNIVMRNRAAIAEYFDANIEQLIIPKQIHSNIAMLIDDDQFCGEILECDALITNIPGVLIGVNTADCVPIILCDLSKKYVAAIHSGWRGALSGVVDATLEKMKSLGCSDIVCGIGPCIKQKSFDVGNEIIENVDKKYIDDEKRFDITMYVSDKLIAHGVRDISKIDIDTFTNNEYFSYRRQTKLCQNSDVVKCGVQFSGVMII